MTDGSTAQVGGEPPAPLITVAMPIYNAGKHLRPAVLSIIRQTVRDWELLIIDDGSTDNALDGISDILEPRIQVLRDGLNKGLAARLNEAIDRARGKYLARMDQDDVSYPARFAAQLDLLAKHPEVDVVAVRAITIADDNEPLAQLQSALTHEDICATPWRGFYFPHPTWLGRLGWFKEHRYASPGPYFCEDQELLLRSHQSSRFATVDKVLFAYRVRQRINWRKQLKTRRTLLAVQLRHFARAGQLLFSGLALLTFTARLVNDVHKLVLQHLPAPRPSPSPQASVLFTEWREVYAETVRPAGAPPSSSGRQSR